MSSSEPQHRPSGTPRQPYLRGMIRKLGSPYEMAAPQTYLWLLFAMLMAIQAPRAFGPAGVMLFATLPVLVVTVVVAQPNGRHRVLRAIRGLKQGLPWFEAHPVTCHPLPADAELDAALAEHGYERATIDGRDIATWSDLAGALQRLTTPMKFPEESRARVLSLLAQMSDENPRRVIVWRDAIATNARNPALLATVVGDWSAHAPTMRPGLLVFVDLPAGDEPPRDVEQHLPHGDRAEPDRKILADAPDGAWWKPVPGELTR